jgi:hypothetical protein
MTFTGRGLQALHFNYLNFALLIADEAGLLKCSGCHSNASAVHPKHRGQKLVRHRQLIGLSPVMRLQQPTGQTLLDQVVPVACGSHAHLHVESHRIPKHEAPELRILG